MFEHVDAYAGDPILTLVETFHKDTREQKVNLGIGLYYDEQGRIPLLPSVQQAEAQRAAAPAPRPYQPMEGAANYRTAVQHLLFGAEHEAVKAGRIATIQTIGGSGALKIGADLLKRYFPTSEVWVSNPTWDNHKAMFEGAGIKVHDYPYYDAATGGVQFDAMIDCLSSLPAKSIVLLHPCCHNPTGVDLSRAQWDQVIALVVEKNLIPFMDIAYQGFGDGLEEDAYAIRAMVAAGVSFFDNSCLFDGLPETFTTTRYHSLTVEQEGLPDVVVPTAYSTDDHEIMALQIKDKQIYGVQFHPESILSEHGHAILNNFLKL